MLRPGLIAASVLLGWVVAAPRATARPAEIFIPQLELIQQHLPADVIMRLPSNIRLADTDTRDLIVQIYPSEDMGEITVALFTCDRSPHSCLVGTISAAAASDNAQRQFIDHQAMATPITLGPEIQGFLREGGRQTPPSRFSSVMWRQDGTLYTVSFRNQERSNLLRIAHLMATDNQPLRSIGQ